MQQTEQETFRAVEEAVRPYVELWKSSLSYQRGLDGNNSGEGNFPKIVDYQPTINAMIYQVVKDASGLTYAEIVKMLLPGVSGRQEAGLFRSLPLPAALALMGHVYGVAREVPSELEIASFPIGAQVQYGLDDPEKRNRDLDALASQRAKERAPNYRPVDLKAVLASCDEYIRRWEEIRAEENRKGFRSFWKIAQAKAAQNKNLTEQIGFLSPDGTLWTSNPDGTPGKTFRLGRPPGSGKP